MIGRIGGGPVRPTLREIYRLVFLILLPISVGNTTGSLLGMLLAFLIGIAIPFAINYATDLRWKRNSDLTVLHDLIVSQDIKVFRYQKSLSTRPSDERFFIENIELNVVGQMTIIVKDWRPFKFTLFESNTYGYRDDLDIDLGFPTTRYPLILRIKRLDIGNKVFESGYLIFYKEYKSQYGE